MACDRSLPVHFGASLDLIRISAKAVGERGATLGRKEAGGKASSGKLQVKPRSLPLIFYWSLSACGLLLLWWERLYT